MASFDFDVVVIGAGIAGFVSAVTATGLGKKAALVEKRTIGGNCTNFTCIPSKALIRAGHVSRLVSRLDDYGLRIGSVPKPVNTDGVMARVRSVVQKAYEKDLPETFERIGIRVLNGTAQFLDNHRISLEGRTISAESFIIASGTVPLIPPIEGLNQIPYLTNETVFHLDQIPKSMIILGGGIDGIEYASAFGRLGVNVTVVEMANRLLPMAEKELVDLLLQQLRADGITIMSGTRAVSFSSEQGKVVLTVQTGDAQFGEIRADAVLVTIGRKINVQELALDKAGVECTPRNIVTDQTLKTTAPNIYACGDVVGPYQLASMAEYQGIIAATNAALPVKKKVNYDNAVFVTFTEPTLAQMGLTETQAREKYGDRMRVYRFDYRQMRRALVDRAECGLAKLICTTRGRLLGAHILGEGAAEVIHELQIIKAFNKPLHAIYAVTHAYPTYAQALAGRAGQLAYLDKMAANPLVRLGLALLPGFKNNLTLSRQRLAESEEAPPAAPPSVRRVDISVKAPGAEGADFHLNALRIARKACVVELPGDVTDYDEEPILTAGGQGAAGERLDLVLDFSNLHHLNGLGAAMLIKAANRVRREGKSVFACSVSEHYQNVLALTGLDQVIRLYSTRNDALAALGVPAPSMPPAAEPKEVCCRDEQFWAPLVDELRVTFRPPEAFNLNVNGRVPVGPVNGFGRLWQKIYWLTVSNPAIRPEEALSALKENFPRLQPSYNRFYTSSAGIKPGEIVLIDSSTPGGPVSTGVLVAYADDQSFTFMCPHGHPESGMITFSAVRGEDDKTVVQILGLARANDPVYELAFRAIGSKMQIRIWTYLLRALANHLGVEPDILTHQRCVDEHLQWGEYKNVWTNAQVRTVLYAPLYYAKRLKRRKKGG